MAAHHIDFWFTMGTLGSTYSYPSVSWLADVERSTGVTFRWRPFHLVHSAKDEARSICRQTDQVRLHVARSPKRLAVRNRRSRANLTATGCRAGATRRFTPPEPINCASGVRRPSVQRRYDEARRHSRASKTSPGITNPRRQRCE